MYDYLLAIINSQEYNNSFERIKKLEEDLLSLKNKLDNANKNDKESLKKQLHRKEFELKEENESLSCLKPWGIDLPWISRNYLSALTLFQLQKEQLKKSSELFKGAWRNEILDNGSLSESNLIESLKKCNLINLFEFYKTPIVDINALPFFSFFLQFTFILAKPYLSRDDGEFYVSDNSIRKDKVLKVPMVSGSIWKGNVRWTARQGKGLNPDNLDDKVIIRLFGNEKAEDKTFNRGRLNFYPTFFDQISLEIVNPHDRKTKAGTIPIYSESVPAGATGIFNLLYVPFDLMGKPSEEIKQEVTEDIDLVYNSLEKMMLTYGFSAKKSSGFGIIEKNIKGIFVMSGNKDKKTIKPESVKPKLTKKKIYSTFNELLSSIQSTEQASSSAFSSFSEMWILIKQVKEKVVNSVK